MLIAYNVFVVVALATKLTNAGQPTLLNEGPTGSSRPRGNEDCHVLPGEVIRVQRGWPFAVPCGLPPHYYGRALTQCMLTNIDTGELLLTVSNPLDRPNDAFFGFGNIARDLNLSMTLTDDSGDCETKKIEVQVVEKLHPSTCDEAATPNRTITVEAVEGSSVVLECQTPKGIFLERNVSVTWFRNCSDIAQTNSTHITVSNVSGQNEGVYSCALSYGGKMQFVSSYRLTTKAEGGQSHTGISCENNAVEAYIGGAATLQCTVQTEDVTTELSQITWTMISSNNDSPITKCTDTASAPQHQREDIIGASCNGTSTNICCEKWLQNDGTAANKSTTIAIRLTFKNVTANDFGLYNVKVESRKRTTFSESLSLLQGSTAVPSSCDSLPPKTVEAITGWPLIMPCDLPTTLSHSETSKVECLVYDGEYGQLLSNSTTHHPPSFVALYPSVTAGLNTSYSKNLITVIKAGNGCWKQPTVIEVVAFRNESCEDVRSGDEPYWPLEPLCYGPAFKSSFDHSPLSQIEVSWHRNCSQETRNNDPTSTSAPISEPATRAPVVCAVTYDGMTKFVRKYEVCGTEKSTAPLLQCNSASTWEAGAVVTVECTLTAERANMSRLFGTWTKSDGNLETDGCRRFGVTSDDLEASGGAFSCSSVALNSCVDRKAGDGGFTVLEQRKMMLSIPNAAISDSGSYELVLTDQFGTKIVRSEMSLTVAEKEPSLEEAVEDCIRHETTVMHAYEKWPFTIRCQVLERYVYYEAEVEYEDEDVYPGDISAECAIWQEGTGLRLFHHTGTIDDLQTSSLEIPDADEDTPRKFLIVAKSLSSCWVQPVEVNITKLPDQTCEEAIAHASDKYPMHKTNLGAMKSLGCTNGDSILDGGHGSQFNVTWLRNCSAVSNASYRWTPGSIRPRLNIDRVTFEHPGVYTCAVTHNGQTQYVVHYPLCVKQPSQVTHPLVKCSQKIVSARLGSQVAMDCVGDLGYTDISAVRVSVQWRKIESNNSLSLLCYSFLGSSRYTNGNVTCNASLSKVPCFHHIPQGDERDPVKLRLQMSINFGYVNQEDFGRYIVMVSMPKSRTYSGRVNATVELVESQITLKKNLRTQTHVIAACIGVVGFVVVAAAALFAYRRCKAIKPVADKYTSHQFVHMELKNQISVRSKA